MYPNYVVNIFPPFCKLTIERVVDVDNWTFGEVDERRRLKIKSQSRMMLNKRHDFAVKEIEASEDIQPTSDSSESYSETPITPSEIDSQLHNAARKATCVELHFRGDKSKMIFSWAAPWITG